MNGMFSFAQIFFRRPAVSIVICSDSTTHVPAIRKNGLSRPDFEIAQFHAFAPAAAHFFASAARRDC